MKSKERIQRYLQGTEPDIEQLSEEGFYYDNGEIGLHHEETGSTLRFRNNGDVELFSKGSIGFVAREQARSLNLYGDKVNVQSKEIHLTSDKLGLTWNNFAFNPDMTDTTLLVLDENLRQALTLLMNGGITVTNADGIPGTTNATSSGNPEGIKPFSHEVRPQIFSNTVSNLLKQLRGL